MAATLFSSCSATRAVNEAQVAVRQLHSNYNAGYYSIIYRNGSEKLHDTLTEDQALNYFATVRSDLGDCFDSKVISYRYGATLSGPPTVYLACESRFAKGVGSDLL